MSEKQPTPPVLSNIVTVRDRRPMVSSLVMADLLERSHDQVLRAIRKVQKRKPNLDVLVDVYRDRKGEERPVYWLAEKASLLVLPYIGGDQSIDGQEKLVDAYLAYHRASERRQDPAWQLVRDETKLGFKWMSQTLQERRAAAGKATQDHHYANEARLINAVLSGRFGGLDRNQLPSDNLSLVADLQRLNALLIGQDLPYDRRKAVLTERATRKLTAH